MLERLLTWAFATLEDAVDLSPTTSGVLSNSNPRDFETFDRLEIFLDFVLTDSLRAVSEELAKERGRMPEGSEKHMPWGQVSWTYHAQAGVRLVPRNILPLG